MKKVLALFLAILLLLCIAGCSSEPAVPTPLPTEAAEATPLPTQSNATEWTEVQIQSLFTENAQNDQWVVVDSVVVSDFAFDCVGAVLFVDNDQETTNVAFLRSDGTYQQCGVGAPLSSEPEFTYCGDGTVSFLLVNDETESYTCQISFSSQNGNVSFVAKTDF